MKTLTEKYQALLEGNFSKKQFTRDARLAHPNFITQFTSYDDAIRILKGKGLVYEKKNEQTSYEDINTHNQEEIPSYLLEAEGDVELRVYLPDSSEVDILDTVSLDQVRKGIDYELKEMGVRSLSIHKDEWSKAKDRVRKNLQKDRNYYLHKLADTKPVKAEKRADTMKEVPTVKATAKGTKSNEKKFKDQQNQMEKVKLSESIKDSSGSNINIIKEIIKKVIVKTLNEESKTNTSIFSNEVKSSPQVVRELDYPRSINQAERRVANEVAREVHQNLNLPTEFHENERLYAAFLAAFEEQALQKMADLFSNAGSAPAEY